MGTKDGVGRGTVREAWESAYILASTYGILRAVSFPLFLSACGVVLNGMGHSPCSFLIDTFRCLGVEDEQSNGLWTHLVNGREYLLLWNNKLQEPRRNWDRVNRVDRH